ncbi:MAG: TlpA family protein disulfide reductase [Bacteroidetes Order II. Incertae sedis bacterium]|nr:TlpA family protein disulfide reductase [Bacteroidetes Order II. bacterium]
MSAYFMIRAFNFLLLVFFFCLPVTQAQSVNGKLTGKIAVTKELDPAQDFSGFQILVGFKESEAAAVDTIGFAITKKDGSFSMNLKARERGIYPLMVSRRGAMAASGEIIVAEGDEATLQATLPARTLRVISPENAAWMALKNARAQHKQSLIDALSNNENNTSTLKNVVLLTSNLMWDLDKSFGAQSVGAQLGKMEAITMLVGWDDSLAVARAQTIPPDFPGYVEMVRTLRRALVRELGQEKGLAAFRTYVDKLPDLQKKAPLFAELIVARIDSLQTKEALAAIAEMERTYPDGRWNTFLQNATYEVKNLLPGLRAPAFSLKANNGQTYTLDGLKGKYVVLEFWSPRDSVYPKQLPEVMALHQSFSTKNLVWLSVALDPEKSVVDTFAQNRALPDLQVLELEGTKAPIAKAYNVNYVPLRFLIGPDGNLIGKYVSNALGLLTDALQKQVK